MNSAPSCQPPRLITARAAENGLKISVCIIVLMMSLALSTSFQPAALLLWGGSLAMPWILYKLLQRSQNESCGKLGFAELWAEGIASFFLGSLMPAVVAYALLKYAFPDYIGDQIDAAADIFKTIHTQKGDMWAQTMERLQNNGATPTAADVAANIISFNIVAGTFISLLVAPFVRFKNCKNCTTGKPRQ